MDIIQKIHSAYPELSKGRKKIAQYVLDNREDIAFSTASIVAEKLKTSPSSIVRFVRIIGYTGYKDFQHELKMSLLDSMDIVDRFKHQIEGPDVDAHSYLIPFEQDLSNINNTFNKIPESTIDRIVEKIVGARNIGVAAMRGAIAPATILQLFANQTMNNVFLLTPGILDGYDRIKEWGKKDLLIGMLFGLQTTYTYSMVKYAKTLGCSTIAITDNLTSPIARTADLSVAVEVEGAYISYTAVIVLVNIILHKLSVRLEGDTIRGLEKTEKILSILDGN